MKKKTLITATILTATITASTFAGSRFDFYRRLIARENIGTVREYYCDELTAEILENRGNSIIAEKIIGTVINSKGDGKIMNPHDPDYDYISYKRVRGARKGDTILTVCIYEPGKSGVDEVIDRFDYIIDRAK